MTLSDIAHLRLQSQQIISKKFVTPLQIVDWLGALQAQDYAMSKWAIGTRLTNPTDDLIEAAINKAEIIRTHVMRPTWHFVSAKDARWMLSLTAPHIKSSIRSNQAKLELSEKLFNRTNDIIVQLLQGHKYLTRTEIVAELKKRKIKLDNLQATHIMFDAELNALICNGPMRGKQFTYALMDERIPPTKALSREEALAKLTLRYFISHGPATIHDFAWWSGLPMADAKKGLELIDKKLASEKVDNKVYWFDPSLSQPLQQEQPLFLAAYDEFMISYTDRSASLDPKFSKITLVGNGIFRPIIVTNGKVIGIWTRVVKKDHVVVQPQFFYPKQKLKKKEVESLFKPYGNFLNLDVRVKSA